MTTLNTFCLQIIIPKIWWCDFQVHNPTISRYLFLSPALSHFDVRSIEIDAAHIFTVKIHLLINLDSCFNCNFYKKKKTFDRRLTESTDAQMHTRMHARAIHAVVNVMTYVRWTCIRECFPTILWLNTLANSN